MFFYFFHTSPVICNIHPPVFHELEIGMFRNAGKTNINGKGVFWGARAAPPGAPWELRACVRACMCACVRVCVLESARACVSSLEAQN